ncbi:MAG: mandelate racemase [Armatimonadota bacterium]|nr:mandelate racemase [Armatimonadota bacterium]
MDNPRIIKIEWGRLEGERPRHAGSNARLGAHGKIVRVPIARLTADDGSTGFGACYVSRERAAELLGVRLETLFSSDQGVLEPGRAFDYPLWDLMGQRAGLPVYALAAAMTAATPQLPYRAPCYDTSLYFDDLHCPSRYEASQLIAAEAREGYERGHRAFKIKVGRGARHMPLKEGTKRDIVIVRAVREAVGSDCSIMLDANNGYNLNLTKHVLAATADCQVFWMEEAFHEDPVLYRDLKTWLAERGLPILIADGEGQASSALLDWAREGLVDVVQYDIFGHGFTRWLHLGRQLDEWGVRSAPHHYGGHYGNYAACHLAGALRHFTYVEWDEATTPGLDASGYSLCDGGMCVPETPGFGLALDEPAFRRAVETGGFCLSL